MIDVKKTHDRYYKKIKMSEVIAKKPVQCEKCGNFFFYKPVFKCKFTDAFTNETVRVYGCRSCFITSTGFKTYLKKQKVLLPDSDWYNEDNNIVDPTVDKDRANSIMKVLIQHYSNLEQCEIKYRKQKGYSIG